MRKLAAIILSVVFFMPTTNAYAFTDEYILNDAIKNTYKGRIEAEAIIENLKFNDINGHWAQEPVIRSGALNLVKGYGNVYNPDATVSNSEAIAFILRAIGRENEAVELSEAMQAQAAAGSSLRTAWALGYLNVASTIGMLTPEEYEAAIAETPSNAVFNRNAAATRERIADWIVKALRSADANALQRGPSIQKAFNYSDFDRISGAYGDSVDLITLNGIMKGDGSGRFNPKKGVTRAEMAQILKNMDKIYFDTIGLQKKTGVVANVNDNKYKTTGQEAVWRNIYVRVSDGTVDVLQYDRQTDNVSTKKDDAPVFKNAAVTGLASLVEGDEIEYIVSKDREEVLYVQVVRGLDKVTINAYYHSINTAENSIVMKDASGNFLVYSLMDGLIVREENNNNKQQNTDDVNTLQEQKEKFMTDSLEVGTATNEENNVTEYLRIDDKKMNVKDLPGGSIFAMELTNSVVTKIVYIGEHAAMLEIRGIVVENNKDLGYITVIDNKGHEVTKYFYEHDLRVKKQQYYDLDDEIGYIDEVFPHFEYNPRESDISQIEPGDIVFLKLAKDDASVITSISASADYMMKYGKIKQISNNDEYTSLLIEYEDKQTGWYDAADDIFVTLDGKPISLSDIKVGDWAKLLVSQAAIAPGHLIESVKEIAIEGNEHFISQILKGNLSGINDVQNQLIVKNSYVLTKTGWNGYKNLTTYDLNGKDIEYYYNDKRISLDYAKNFFKRSDATVFVALENNYTGDKVKKITFRLERDEALAPDMIMYSSGAGTFGILSHTSNIIADSGTIVRRHGRLVDAHDIMSSDYAYVVLSGEDKAAIVDIIDSPAVSNLMISRGRIKSVDEGISFKTQSMSVLSGNEWIYTPVQREYGIDHDTIFINSEGKSDIFGFTGYTEDSVIDKVYNIVVDGNRAAYVVESPYCTRAVKGEIYEIDGDTVYIKDSYYYMNDSGKWRAVSERNSTLSINILTETIIGKNNSITTGSALSVGDQIRVLSNELPDRVSPGSQIDGYIILVEN